IRVFSDPPPTQTEGETLPPRKQFFYPLYSTRTLYGTESTFKIADEVSQLQTWNQLPGLFTDLNEPVEYFPPRALRDAGSTVKTQQGTLIYPIVDPTSIGATPDQPIVDGVSVTGNPPGASERNRMPMPVMWLYVLSDGTLITPQSGGADGKVRFDSSKFQSRAGLPKPTIVGRIAYWTDDESCKVNVNTASEPSPWVQPHTSGPRERDYAESEPARGEYHRLSGHPAFTALAPVFRGMGTPNPEPMMVPVSQPLMSRGVNDFKNHIDLIHGLIPRGNELDTGTEHGTQPLTPNSTLATERRFRLFADLDEMLFNTGGSGDENRMRNGAGSTLPGGFTMDQADIRRGRFYLSTHSNSPELNPFNLPKISLWPVMENPSARSRFDDEMALAATLGGVPGTTPRPIYALQRADIWSGSGATGSSQSRHADRTISRNQALYNYLLEMTGDTNSSIPGFAANFDDKLGLANRDQVLTMMFDTMRWIANPENAWTDDGDTFEYLPPTDPSRNPQLTGAASAVPMARATNATTSGEVKGLGRFPTISQVALILVATDAETNPSYDENNPNSAYFKDDDGDGYADKITKMRAFFIVEPFNPNPGHPAVSPTLRYQIEMPTDFTVDGRGLNLANGGTIGAPVCLRASFSPSFTGVLGNRQLGGNASAYSGMASLFVTGNGVARKALGFMDEDLEFPWASSSETTFATAHESNQPLQFVGSEISIHIRTAEGSPTSSEIIQTVKVDFSQLAADTANIHFPCPKLKASKPEADEEKDPRNIWSRFAFEADARVGAEPQGVHQRIIRPGDVVRAMEIDPLSACGGDMRLVAAQKEVPSSWFRPVRPATATLSSLPGSNTTPDSPELHHLRDGAYTLAGQMGYSWGGAGQAPDTTVPQPTFLTGGTLLPGVAPAPYCVSAVPPSLQGALVPSDPGNLTANLRLGDWNTGAGILEDGPYASDLDLGNAITELSGSRSDPYADSLLRR
ncbi:MAG: Verru_Chthon cassette protein A, partial [Verrucomicrobiales bacterium]|nr:Verru_Chthon cassette protein A [Verrucomicrobiales bacterium]